ncbi:hypothetical protein BD410DRAFT_895016 [Rickenella mellea]|uniref:Transmembrane protein n=1 Tax=Rickenella mellea TaxID=50990 RepID=A0A4Y7QIN9_9AGAM|nr:hypothetical protein BD410DRAFT_895016 [Rickenella mellea]
MEEKYLRRFDCIKSKLRSSFDRIKLSRLFSAYVVLSLVFCLFQVTSGFIEFANDNAASSRFTAIIEQAKIPRRFAFQLPNNTILICDDISGNQNCNLWVAGNNKFKVVGSKIGTQEPTSLAVIPTGFPSTGQIMPSPHTPSFDRSSDFSGSSSPEPRATPFRPHEQESVQPLFRFARKHALRPGVDALGPVSVDYTRRSLNIQPRLNSSGGVESLTLTGLVGQSQPVTLTLGCIEFLAWPDILFRNARREDLTMVSFHVWVLVMSVASIIYGSIPHLAAAFLGNCASLGWSISQVTSTARFSKAFYNAVTVNACGGVELRTPALMHRYELALAGLIITVCFFSVFALLSYKIFQIYRHQCFQRVGATNEVYTIAIGFCICLHLSGFLVISAGLLWLEETLNSVIRKYLPSTASTIVPFFVGITGHIPRLFMGSNIVFRERKVLMLIFLVLGVCLSAMWASTMASPSFRYTLGIWPFFASLSVLSLISLVATTTLGIVCRYNFGKGLKHYIMVLEVLEDARFTPGVFPLDPENGKIASHSQERALAAALAARDAAILAGIPDLNLTFSTISSSDDTYADADKPSQTEKHPEPVQLALNDPVGPPPQTDHFSVNSNGTEDTELSFSSWLWWRSIAILSRSRARFPTSAAPSTYRASRDLAGTPESQFSIVTGTSSSSTVTTSDASQFVTVLFFSPSTVETKFDEKPLPSLPL